MKNTKNLIDFEKKRTALVEVTVHKEEIAELLAQKMSITAIHRALVDKYTLKTSYSGFVKVLGRINLWKSTPQKKKQVTVKAVSQPQPASPPKEEAKTGTNGQEMSVVEPTKPNKTKIGLKESVIDHDNKVESTDKYY